MLNKNQFLDDATDYELVGGKPAVEALVDRLCELLREDDQLVDLFGGGDGGADLAQLKHHQVLLLSQVLGGPECAEGRDLRQAHACRHICHDDYRKVTSYLVQALVEAGVMPAVIGRVGEALAATEQNVVAVRAC